MENKAIEILHQLLLEAVRRTLKRGVVEIDAERCKGCELCAYECPARTLRLSATVNRRGYRHTEQVNPERCIGCASCAKVCPDGCITVYGEGININI